MGTPDYASGTDRVRARLDGVALQVVLDNPARHNALSVDMWSALPPLLARAAADDRVRLVVLQGAGNRAFASGADISQFEDQRASGEAVARYEALSEEALSALQHLPKPTLACVRGWCLGAGLNVAMACDVRIAADDAVFGIPAARMGLGYRDSALKNLIDLIGVGPAKDLFFTARRIDAAEALRLGLVTRVVAPDALPALLAEYVQAIGDNAPLTIAAAKATAGALLRTPPGIDLAHCRQLTRACFDSDDYVEGRRAFMDKRRPRFKGQ
jgi:enoyl-CoA hydratase